MQRRLKVLRNQVLVGEHEALHAQVETGPQSPVFPSCLAEREGFEPTVPCGTPDFESGTFGHSATSPDGFSLHAAVRCGADDRQALEQLCRYITRPALANERVQTNAAGQVVLKLKTLWRDGTTHIVMSPLEFMQRLAALVPRPRLHLIRLVSA